VNKSDKKEAHLTVPCKQRAFVIGVEFASTHHRGAQPDLLTPHDSLEELVMLAEGAGLEVAGTELVHIVRPTPGHLVGRGRLSELKAAIHTLSAEVAVWDTELSPTQERNLAHELGATVVDRVAVILEIFARRATTPAGQYQVERAQLEYLLPRLAGHGREMSRLGGGIGTRGPGETQLEMDRRLIRKRIQFVDKKIAELTKRRQVEKGGRIKSGLPVVAIVGYTNAGKSTLLNALTQAGVLVDDAPFATLEPTVRRLHLPDGSEVLLTDTVGFINRLPHQLVKAFATTLAEAAHADLWLLVLDASDENYAEKEEIVRRVLGELDKGEHQILVVLNKTDLLPQSAISMLNRELPDSVSISALKRQGLDEMLNRLEILIKGRRTMLKVYLKAADGRNLAWLHSVAEVTETVVRGTRMTVSLWGDMSLPGRMKARGLRFRLAPELVITKPNALTKSRQPKVAWKPAKQS
jgi:GTP-binding protein HflX